MQRQKQLLKRFRELVGIVELLGLNARVFVGDGACTSFTSSLSEIVRISSHLELESSELIAVNKK